MRPHASAQIHHHGRAIHFSDLLAVAATRVVALCYAIGPVIVSRKLNDVPAIGVVTASLIVATLIYAPFAPMAWPEHFPAFAAWSVVGLGVLCTAAAFLVFFAGDRGLRPRDIATAQTALVRHVGVGS